MYSDTETEENSDFTNNKHKVKYIPEENDKMNSSNMDQENKSSDCISTHNSSSLSAPSPQQTNQATAFTIEFNDERQVDTSKYKSLMDKFQKRHKRGSSLSKLDEKVTANISKLKSSIVGGLPRNKSSLKCKTIDSCLNQMAITDNKKIANSTVLKTRVSRSTSFQEHKHSISHKTNMQNFNSNSLSPLTSSHDCVQIYSEQNLNSLPEMGSFADCQPHHLMKSELQILDSRSSENSINEEVADCDSGSSVSEAGTYTIENDTYTEEQKAKMSIDQQLASSADQNQDNNCALKCSSDSDKLLMKLNNKPVLKSSLKSNFIQYGGEDIHEYGDNPNLDVVLDIQANKEIKQKNITDKNILEVSYFYEPQKDVKIKTHNSVLEKLKKRVSSISERTLNKSKTLDNNLDLGSFTSVTTSGILSNNVSESQNKSHSATHETNTFGIRKKSLTKSQIDTSEYPQSETKKKNNQNIEDAAASGQVPNAVTESWKLSKPTGSPILRNSDKTVKSFENGWIYEWAKSASEHNRKQLCLQSVSNVSNKPYMSSKTKISNNILDHMAQVQSSHSEISLPFNKFNNKMSEVSSKLPPKHPSASPTKIPSPISTLARPRSRSSISLSGSTAELNSPVKDTYSYLCKTEDAINNLSQNMSCNMESRMSTSLPYSDSRNVSPMHSLDSSLSPKRSPKHISYVTISSDSDTKCTNRRGNIYAYKSESSPTSPQKSADNHFTRSRMRHTRHFSFDNNFAPCVLSANDVMNNSLSHNNEIYDKSYKVPYEHSYNLKLSHGYFDKDNKETFLHSNFDNLPPKPIKCFINKNESGKQNIDQTSHIYVAKDNFLNQQKNSFNKDLFKDNNFHSRLYNKTSVHNDHVSNKLSKHQNSPNSSPIRRSSSFSTERRLSNEMPSSTRAKQMYNQASKQIKPILRSASNANVKNFLNIQAVTSDYSKMCDCDPCYDKNCIDSTKNETESESENEFYENESLNKKGKEAIKNTRCNRAFSLRRARLEGEKNETKKNEIASKNKNNKIDAKNNSLGGSLSSDFQRKPVRSSLRERASMPRDSSLQRIKLDLNINHDISVPQKKGTPTIQPRYMDISKYKSSTSGNFLRKDESKSYLDAKNISVNNIKSKPLYRNESSRLSLRSNKATGNKTTTKKENVKNATKEQELANWRRRATYDPMKAAAEGKKKADLAKKMTNPNTMAQSLTDACEDICGNSSGAVLRSQSYHGSAALDWISSSPGNRMSCTRSIRNADESPVDSSDEEFTLS